MKKLILLLFIPLVFGCGSLFVNPEERIAFQKNFQINEGMTKQEVIDIMGVPVASEFSKGVEEFHYCATGYGSDDYVAFFFKDGKVVSKTSYNVTLSEVGGATGHCSKFVKRGTYRTPNNVVELRATIN
tara:strand:+ start:37 stop:423 length:387 start_codon:yes stop_codon:yes gene_type:complete